MHVKICGVTNVQDAVAAASRGADFVGLIRAKSARSVGVETAAEIVRRLADFATRPVLLYRDAPRVGVTEALQQSGAQWVQLHGAEPVEYLRELTEARPQTHIIKAWEIASENSGKELLTYARRAVDLGLKVAAYILDAPKGGPHPGFAQMAEISRQWNASWPRDTPDRSELWCAGGLTPDSLEAAVADGAYDGVDVARGVESEPGRKDTTALGRFIEIAKRL